MSNHVRHACAGILATAMLAAPSAPAAPPGKAGTGRPPVAPLPMITAAPATRAPQTRFDRFIVKYRGGAAAQRGTAAITTQLDLAARRALATSAPRGSRVVVPTKFRFVRSTAMGAMVVHASRALTDGEVQAFIAELKKDANVEYAQPDFVKHAFQAVPNDPQFSVLQWDFTHPVGGVGAPAAWETSSGEGVVVAVLDTGYAEHADLVGNIVPGYDFVSYYGQTVDGIEFPDIAGDGDGRDADARDPGDWTDAAMPWCGSILPSSWHGTHVAGTVAAVANNARDIAGLAHGARVQPVRVLGHCGGLTSDISDAVIWASGGTVAGVPANANPAEVLNLSLGGVGSCDGDPVTQEAINDAVSRGTTVVVAAGNDSGDAGWYTPASCANVITVGANGVDGGKSWFSNYGIHVALSAPGGNATSGGDAIDRFLWSLGNTGTQGPEDDALTGMIGTSQAAPHVAAVVAMMQSAAVAAGKPPLTPRQARHVLRSTARPFAVQPPAGMPIGAGILDAAAATHAATLDIPAELPEVLTNGVPLAGQAGAAGDTLLYSLEVPPGTRSLNLRSLGGVGNVSLYVSFGSAPTAEEHQRRSVKPGNNEAVVVSSPQPGTWYMRIVGEVPFENVSVMGLHR